MKRIPILLFALMLLISIAGCGGGGGNGSSSDASRFIGSWAGQMVETGNDYGGAFDTIQLQMQIEFAGKETIGGFTTEYVTVSIFFDGQLGIVGVVEANPGGIWDVDVTDAGTRIRMLGQFTGNNATGSFEMYGTNPDPPNQPVKLWGSWTAHR